MVPAWIANRTCNDRTEPPVRVAGFQLDPVDVLALYLAHVPHPEIIYPLKIDTIGKLLAMNDELTVHCFANRCNHSGRMNLVALGNRLGFDHSCLMQISGGTSIVRNVVPLAGRFARSVSLIAR